VVTTNTLSIGTCDNYVVTTTTLSIGTCGNYKDFLLEHVVTTKAVYDGHVTIETIYIVATYSN
jgi:hypothetical protein